MSVVATDLASFPIDWTELGLPEAKDVLGCIGFSGVKACTVPGKSASSLRFVS